MRGVPPHATKPAGRSAVAPFRDAFRRYRGARARHLRGVRAKAVLPAPEIQNRNWSTRFVRGPAADDGMRTLPPQGLNTSPVGPCDRTGAW